MTRTRLMIVLSILALSLLVTGCPGLSPQPSNTTSLASASPIPPSATPTAGPTTDMGATVEASVRETLTAVVKAWTPTPTATQTVASTPTPTSTATPQPIPTTASPITSTTAVSTSTAVPAGKWMVRAYKIDDAAAIFVNGQLIGIAQYQRDLDWININPFMVPGQDTVVAFASYNGSSAGSYGFAIRRDDTTVWGVEKPVEDDWALSYAEQVIISTQGDVEVRARDEIDQKPPPDRWYVRAQNIQDIGGILVNGQPVVVNWNRPGDWVDITNLLYSDRNNQITMAAWNVDSGFAWDFAVRRADTIVWAKQDSGAGDVDRVFQEVLTVDPNGIVVQTLPSGHAAEDTWAVRLYETDDASVAYVNGQLVGTSLYEHDMSWTGINQYMVPGQDTILAFASYNGGNGGRYGFGLRRNDITVWGVEGSIDDDWVLSFAEQVLIHADGTVELLPRDVSARKPPPGKWYVRVQNVQDVGGILVNGQPVALHWNREDEWHDITGLLYSDRDNTVNVAAWNFDGANSWDFAIKRDDEILWAVSNTGAGQTGLVLSQNVTITRDGQVRQ